CVHARWGADLIAPRSQFPAELEKRRGARVHVFSSQSWGVARHFFWNGTAVRRRCGERGVPMQGRVSGPGYLTSLGTKPPLCALGTLCQLPTRLRQDVIACGGGQQTGDTQLSKGPAKSELDPAWAQ